MKKFKGILLIGLICSISLTSIGCSKKAVVVEDTAKNVKVAIVSKSSVDIAQNSCKDAQNNYNTVHQQYNIGDSSKDELDASKSKLDNATTQLNAANDSLELIKSKLGPESNAAAAGQVEQAQGALD